METIMACLPTRKQAIIAAATAKVLGCFSVTYLRIRPCIYAPIFLRCLEASPRRRSTSRALRAGCSARTSRGMCLRSCATICARSRKTSWRGIQNYEFLTQSCSRRGSPLGFPSESLHCETRFPLSEYFPFVEIVHSLP